MKKLLLFIFFSFAFLLKAQTVNYNMANSTQTVPCGGTFNFYDSGGPGGQYTNSQDFTTVFVPSTPGQCLKITFTSFATESGFDFVRIYDGNSIAAPLLGQYSGSTLPPVLTGSSGSLTVRFTSDGSVVGNGWAAVISCTSCPAPPPPPSYYLQSAGTQTLSCPPTYSLYYDSGGPSANYANSENSLKTFSTTPGTCLSFSFTSFATESCCDRLRIFDGPNGGSPLIGTYAGVTSPGQIISSGSSLSFSFTSDGSVVNSGWSAIIACTTCPAPPAYYVQSAGTQTISCPPTYTLFYDSGGPSNNYNNSENSLKTFSTTSGNCLQFNFTSFSTESCCDRLRIFDGPNGGSPLIGTYAGGTNPGLVTSSGSSMSFSFTSDGSVVNSGWSAEISCLPTCTGTPVGGTAIASPANGCASFTTTLNVSGASSACGLTYQWQSSASLSGPFANISGATAYSHTTSVVSNTYFRRLTSCGAQTATSGVVATSVGTTAVVCSMSSYAASATTYSFDSFVGTTLPTTDDVLFSSSSQLGFPFCYTGFQYSSGFVSSNSSFVFGAVPCYPNIYAMPGAVNAAAGIGTGWSITLAAPTASDNAPRNAILAPWQDINPGVGGTMRMATLGTAPNRRFVVSFENVPMFSCTSILFTGQIKLFETTNDIEIHIGNKPLCSGWNSGRAIMGLHNHDGTIYVPPVNNTAHNSPTQWTMSNTAYRFSSSCPSQTLCGMVLPVEFKSLYGQQIDGVNRLWWETSDDKDTKEFIVERSLDAENFEPIHLTAGGKGPKYIYNDNTFKRGSINYYRVTAIEHNGKKTSTYVYSIFNTNDQLLIGKVYPNPSSDKINVDINGRGASADCTINVYDQMGNKVISKNEKISFGNNTLVLDIQNLNNGIYVLEIITEDNMVISKSKISKM